MTNSKSKVARFGCGFVFGLFLVLGLIGGTDAGNGGYGGAMYVLGIALICGLAAMLFGEAFWRWASKWLP